MSTMFADTLLIVFISVCTALLAEGECWAAAGRVAASLPQRAAGRWGPSRLGAGGAGRPWGPVLARWCRPREAWGGSGAVGGRREGAGRRLLPLACAASPPSAGRERVKGQDWGHWGGCAERKGGRVSEGRQDSEGVKRGSVTRDHLRPGVWRPVSAPRRIAVNNS